MHRRHRPIECGLRIGGELRANDPGRALVARSFGGAEPADVSIHGREKLACGASEPFGPFRDGGCLGSLTGGGLGGWRRWWWVPPLLPRRDGPYRQGEDQR